MRKPFFIIICLYTSLLFAQNWSRIIGPSRATDWSNVTTTVNDEYVFGWAICAGNCFTAGMATGMSLDRQDTHGNISNFQILTSTSSTVNATFKDGSGTNEGAGMMTFK